MKKILFSVIISLTLTFCYGQSITDVTSFETLTTKIIIDNTGGKNLWQIGKPQKPFFDSAHSATKAILTDTINYYPPNDTSSFIYIIRNTSTLRCPTTVGFFHKYDMDTVGDKGLIDASYDGGISWIIIKDTTFLSSPLSFFNWDIDCDFYSSAGCIVAAHNVIISGRNPKEWVQSSFSWQWKDTSIINPDSLMIRFTFISDSITKYKEGWMIDDIVTTKYGSCLVDIKENSDDVNVHVSPNPFFKETTLSANTNLKNKTLTIYNSQGQQIKQIKNIEGHFITLQRDNLSSGLYFFNLTEGGKILATNKLIIVDN